MGHDWILDVLADLQTFARANGMPTLAAQLTDASYVAQVEIASKAEGDGLGIIGAGTSTRRVDRTLGIR
jgi:hypothetical protein